ncbi:MAG: FAD-binding domain-containing protein, partial [Oceanobacter sp.]
PQAQMQSGESGINVLRMYNPTKQAQLQDPKGVFIRRWLPELAQVPDSYIHQPWKMNSRLQRESGVEIGKNYPAPIVDFDQAIREARSKISPIVKQQDFREQADAVGQKHGSRQKKNSNRKPPSSKTLPSQQGRQSNQLELF